MKIVQSESRERPVEVDETSSPTTVYLRDNVEESTRPDGFGEEHTVFVYRERQLTRQEYNDLKTAEYVLDLECRLAQLEMNGGLI